MSTRRAFITGAVAGVAAAIGGPEVEKRFFGGSDSSKPKETKPTPEPTKVIPESDATIEELPLILPSSLASVLGYSGYDELWDSKGRVKSPGGDRWYKVFTAKATNIEGSTNERQILSDFPRAITKLRLSPAGESFLINTTLGEGSGRFSFSDSSSMFEPFPPSTMVLFRPTQLGGKQKLINLPVGAPATYDGKGKVFVYTTGKVTNLGIITIDLGSGAGSPIDPPKDLLFPEIRIYDLKKPGTETPVGQPSLSSAAYESSPLNKRWARFLSHGRADKLEAVYLRNSAENNNFAVTPDGQWVCVPVDENFYWTEGNRRHVAMSKGLMISRLFEGKLAGQEEKTVFQDLNSLIRVSPLEYLDLNGQARAVEVVGATEQGQFLVAFYQKPVKGFDIREAVLGMVNPQAGGGYEIRYVSLPKAVLEINRRMAGVFPNFRPEINEYLNTPYISNEKLKELAGLPAWRRYKLENGNWEQDRAFPIHQGQEQYLNVPKPTPTPTPTRPRRLPGEDDL